VPDLATSPDTTGLDDAGFVSQDVPIELEAGTTFLAEFTFQNTGATTWSEEGQFRLGSQTPQDNETWGTGRLVLEDGVTVGPGSNGTFTATLTAPVDAGAYDMQWRMVHEDVNWFGDPTALLSIQVLSPCAEHCGNGELDCGEIYIDCGGGCASCVPVEIAPQSAKGGYPRVAAAGGRLMVVWERGNFPSSDSTIHFTCFNGASWTPIQPVAPSVTGVDMNPWLVIDGQGRFHLVYSNGLGDSRQVHYLLYDAADCSGTWHDTGGGPEPEVVSAQDVPFSSPYASVSVDEDDIPYVTWSQARLDKGTVPCNPSCNCDDPNRYCYGCEDPFEPANPGVCLPNYDQHFSRRLAGGWEPPMEVVKPGGIPGYSSHHGALFVRSSISVHHVWLQSIGGARHQYYSRFDGETWSPAEFTGIWGHAADLTVDSETVYVFSCTAQFTTRPLGQGGWTPVVSQGNGTDITLMSLQQDSTGGLHTAWLKDGLVQYSVRDPAGEWVTESVSAEDETAWEPWVTVDADDHTHLVWTRCTLPDCMEEHGSVWYLGRD